MRSLFLFLLTTTCWFCNAQTDLQNKATFFIGFSPESQLIFNSDTLTNIQTSTAKPVFGFSVNHLLKSRFYFGVMGSFHSVPFDIQTNSIKTEEGKLNIKYIGFQGKYLWSNNVNRKYTLSSGIALGYDYTRKKSNIYSNGKTTLLNETYTQLRLSLILLDAELDLKNNFSVMGNLTLGAPTLLSMGIGYKW